MTNAQKAALKAKILIDIVSHPGTRLRYIGSRIHYPHIKLLLIMDELEKAGKVKVVHYQDFANMEFYNEWYIAEN